MKPWAAYLLLSATAGVAWSQFEVELNGMRIREPASMVNEYQVAMGDFGVPAYGASLLAELLYLPDHADGCRPLPDVKQMGRNKDLPLIVLARRGTCYFVEKAWNAQEAGANAVLIMDNVDEGLLTMSNPEDRPEIAKLKNDVNIPCALVQKAVGDKLVAFLTSPEAASVVVELDWTEAVAHPDDRVEWEFWTSSNDGCGRACDRQGAFKRDFQATAMQFEQHGYTAFAPHFMHRKCPNRDMASEECRANCLHHGRYCAYDSIADEFSAKFKPHQVVLEDKRQLCVFQQASQHKEPWLWWRFAASYGEACTMANGHFGQSECAKGILLTLGLDGGAVKACMGDSEADKDHPLLQADMQAQGSQGLGTTQRVLLLPTVIINTNQYRGRLDGGSLTRALCAGFAEATEPELCLSGSLQYNDCAEGNGGCWAQGNASACVDTFRGRTCQCPQGYKGDGLQCTDVDECAEGTAACDQTCTNTQGGYECSCKPGFRLFGGHSTVGLCLPKDMCGPAEESRCEMGCITSGGQAQCTCNLPGLELNQQDATTCEDINECATDNGGCQQTCTNFDPRTNGQRFACSCAHGSMVDPNNRFKCVDQKQILQRLGVQNALEAAGMPAGTTWAALIGAVGAAAAITLAIGAALWHFRMRSQTQQQIRDIMKQYMPLDGDSPEHDAQQKQRLAAQLVVAEEHSERADDTAVV